MAEEVAKQPVALLRSVGGLVFDATLEERHEAELQVTDNPVETGVIVSDHAFMKPLRVSITAGVTDTPLRDVVGDKFSEGESRVREAFRLLTELQKKAEPFDVQTGLKLYSNMVCTAIRTAQNKDSANSLVFSADLREVIIVSTEAVTYPPRKAGATKEQASKKVQKGAQQGKQVTEAPKRKSLAKSLSDALGVKP